MPTLMPATGRIIGTPASSSAQRAAADGRHRGGTVGFHLNRVRLRRDPSPARRGCANDPTGCRHLLGICTECSREYQMQLITDILG